MPVSGVLHPQSAAAHLSLERHPPSADLADFVDRFWIVRWDLEEPYEQETLPFPCANLVIGSHRPGLFGVPLGRFVARLEGRGSVVGAKFKPAGLRAFVDRPMIELTGRSLPIGEAFGEPGDALDRDVHALDADRARIERFEAFFRARSPVLEPEAIVCNQAVEWVQSDPSIARVTEVAEKVGTTVRALERAFRNFVGVSPKWVIRRTRAQEAAVRAAEGLAVDWGSLAQQLGYFDQAHFIRDFKAQVGRTPAEYAAACRSSA